MGAAREGVMVRDKGFYWDLFVATLQLSAFTVGGGFVIVPLMRRKFIREKQWLDGNGYGQLRTASDCF